MMHMTFRYARLDYQQQLLLTFLFAAMQQHVDTTFQWI
jgi:hypothetical protein